MIGLWDLCTVQEDKSATQSVRRNKNFLAGSERSKTKLFDAVVGSAENDICVFPFGPLHHSLVRKV